MRTNKMTVQTFVTNCVKYSMEFELNHYERESYDEYCVHIIFGNNEYIIPTYDEHKLAEVWNKILEYYVY